ncbi:MAG TPA: hypothetical protein V6C63_12690 [Allocoleopsis sp.]
MKLLRYALLSVLILVLAIALPARTQTVDVSQLPANLNVALCMNDWNRASSMVQQLLGSNATSAASKQQLILLQRQIEKYRAGNFRVDQSDACAAAVASGLNDGNLLSAETASNNTSPNRVELPTQANPAIATCSAGTMSVDGRCLSNQTAARRHNRSWELGDRPTGQ